jgi:hypothetical protein
MASDMTLITTADFNQLTASLIGQPLSQLSYSYEDVLVLHFGKLTNYSHPKLSHFQEGEWQLLIKMSNWLGGTGLVNLKLEELTIENDLTLKLRLADYYFTITPDVSEAEDLPYWELWLPKNYYIVASAKGLELRSSKEVIK